MSRIAGFLVFFGIVVALVAGVHAYIWLRLVRDTHLGRPWRGLATALLIILAISGPVAFFLRRAVEERTVSQFLVWPAMIWMGLAFILFWLLLAVDAARSIGWAFGKLAVHPPPDPSRRLFLARLAGGAVAAVAAGATAYGIREAIGPVAVREVRVPLRRLPRALDGTTIVQLTDVHVGPTVGRAFVEDVVRRTNALHADVIVITGDLVDGSVEHLRDAVAPLGDLRSRHGTYFCTGNHEFYSGVDEWVAELGRLGIKVLRNERVTIGDGDASYDLAGVDDYAARREGGIGPDLATALAGRDPSRELVLLAHQPKVLPDAAAHGVGLQLSGHTHGGQIWPFNHIVKLVQPVVAGLARERDTWIYVSCGTGYWGPPMRLGAPAEITRIALQAIG